MSCGECGNARKNSEKGVYCRLFGLLIYAKHEGCRYQKAKDEGNATTGNRNDMDADAAEKG